MTTPVDLSPAEADPVLGPLIDAFTACMCAEIQATPKREVCKCDLVAGDIRPPSDFCQCGDRGCGQAWVRLGDETPSNDTEGARRRACQSARRRIEVECGIYRCQAVHSSTGKPPSYERRRQDAFGSIADIAILRRAMYCCDILLKHNVQFVRAERLPVEGQCGGVILLFTIDA